MIVPMNRSHLPFRFGLVFGKGLVRTPLFLELGRELLGEFRIQIVQHNRRFLVTIDGLIEEGLRLLNNPRRVGVRGGLREDHFP